MRCCSGWRFPIENSTKMQLMEIAPEKNWIASKMYLSMGNERVHPYKIHDNNKKVVTIPGEGIIDWFSARKMMRHLLLI